jgi:two-component system, response regulator PdtaR
VSDLEDSPADRPARPTVLLVEDEVLIRWAVAEAMRDAGLHVIEASNAAEAMDVVLSGLKPDILFTDVRMPGHIDGLELAAFLETLLPGLTVIIASAHFNKMI